MEKVKLPREVAKAIERLKERNRTWTMNDLFHVAVNRGYSPSKENYEDVAILREWAFTYELRLATAFLSGYESENTPVEQAIEWCVKTDCISRGKSAHDVVMAIKHILEKGATA